MVALGGLIGTLARYGVGVTAERWLGRGFPFGTLTVNVVGCFLIGLVGCISHKSHALPPYLVTAINVGFLGGLTTFSAFGNETFRHFEAGRTGVALASLAANLLLGLTAVWAGDAAGQSFLD
jgi:CrcB protein